MAVGVVVAAGTGNAGVASIDRLNGDPVTCCESLSAFTELDDCPGEFVPEYEGKFLFGERVRFYGDEQGAAVVLMKIRAADTVEADFDFDFPRSGGWLGNIDYFDVSVSLVHSCTHRGSPSVLHLVPGITLSDCWRVCQDLRGRD